MRYYILYPDNTEADTINDINQLGDVSFKTFWDISSNCFSTTKIL